MGSEEVISAMHAATQRLNTETMSHPYTIATGPPLVYPTEKDAATHNHQAEQLEGPVAHMHCG